MSTEIITKTKVSVGAVPPSTLAIVFDYGIAGGTEARAEMTPDVGYLQLHLMSLSTDPEVRGEVYVQLDGREVMLASLDENSSADIDVDEAYGELLVRKLVLVGRTKTTTTAWRKVTLNYSGGLFDFR